MSIASDLYAHLSTYPGLTAIVGNRCYPVGEVPQPPTLPYVAYALAEDVEEMTLAGTLAASRAAYEFTCYASSQLVLKDLTTQVRAALRAFAAQVLDVADIHERELDWLPDLQLFAAAVTATILHA